MDKRAVFQKKLKSDLLKAKKRLEYSYGKVQKIHLSEDLQDEPLETLESFASRFARYSDLVISRYFRFLCETKDPGFRGSIVDILNQAEKQSWISSSHVWKRIRELRNLSAHEYDADSYLEIYRELIQLTPTLLSVSLQN